MTAIDPDPHYLAQARWAAAEFGLGGRITFRRMQVYDLAREAKGFDLVLFMGVFYHLRHPMLGLDIVARRVRRLLVFQTLSLPGDEVLEVEEDLKFEDRGVMKSPGWPTMAFIEHRLAGDPTNWWVPNHAAVEAMLRSSGLEIIGRPGHEIYLSHPSSAEPSAPTALVEAEYLSATGRPWHERWDRP